MKIIIVENEQRARQGICRLIESISGDYEVVAQASNGETALELIRLCRAAVHENNEGEK